MKFECVLATTVVFCCVLLSSMSLSSILHFETVDLCCRRLLFFSVSFFCFAFESPKPVTLRTINSQLSSLIFGTNNVDIHAPQVDMAVVHWGFRQQDDILIVLMQGVWHFMFLNQWKLSSKMF